MKVFSLLLIPLGVCFAKNTFSPYWGEYNTTGGPVEGKINVHIVSHTHDDTGWLITVDQYFYQRVNYIISTVMLHLEENPDRKFMYVETGFFERWWVEQDEATQNRFRTLVHNGQLEFVNGGWCMHDEAAPTYVEMVENTGRGHMFLKKNFGITPKGTWQIDPFGHTNTQAWLIGQYAGMQYLYFGRMDYEDFNMRKNLTSMVAPDVPRSLEWVWQGSKTFGKQYQTFTGELYGGGNGGYGAPDGLNFEYNTNQVQDDPRLNDYNIDDFVETFVKAAQDQAEHMRSNHVLFAMGSDFNYEAALQWYHNLDKLIHHVNANGTVNAFYSTPTIYTKEKRAANLTWEARYDDVMPLADNAHHYWSGYFTSRQSLKKYLRVLTNVLNGARQMAMLTETDTCKTTTYTDKVCTDNLEAALSVTTHHDGLSGTEKQAVADDYAQRMAVGEKETRTMMAQVLDKVAGFSNPDFCYGTPAINISFCPFTTDRQSFSVLAYNPQGRASSQVLRVPIKGASAKVTGPDGSAVDSQTIPITKRELGLSSLYLQFSELNDTDKVASYTNNATHVVTFVAELPAVGYNTYKIEVGSTSERSHASKHVAAPTTIQNEFYSITFDDETGNIATLKNLKSGVTTDLTLDIGFYNSSVGGCTAGVGTWKQNEKLQKVPSKRQRREEFENGMDEAVLIDDNDTDNKFACDNQKSGAYIFRPNSTTVFPAACTEGDCDAKPTITSSVGELVSEVYITYAPWATLVVRLIKGQARVEVDYTVGPIPQPAFEGGDYLQGKEIVLRYNTSMSTNGVFYTDSNAREMVKRVYNKRGPAYPEPYQISEPVAGNYYPVNAILGLEDESANTGFSVVVDRSMGGASLEDGSLELMVHRRTQADDSRGVGQPMNETMCGCRDQDPNNIGQCGCEGLVIKGTNYLYFDHVAETNANRRAGFEDLNFGAITAFSEATPSKTTFKGLSKDLPANIKLMTFGVVSPQYNDEVFLRLSHIFEAGEHPTLSQVTNVSLSQVFAQASLKVVNATEMSLTGNQTPQDVENERIQWPVAGEEKQMPNGKASLVPGMQPFDAEDASFTVSLRPMDIRTFIVKLQ